jgi:HlyD family secretion protein
MTVMTMIAAAPRFRARARGGLSAMARRARLYGLAALLALAGCTREGSDPAAIVLSGTVDAHQVDVSFQVAGRISRLNTDEGRRVKQGEIVAEIDPRDYELALARARAQADAAQKALAVLKAGTRPQDIRAAQAAVAQAEADLRLAQAQLRRMTELVAKHFVSEQQLDTARNQAEVAAARLDQARQTLSLAREGPRREDIDRAAADYAAARSAADTAEQQLAYVKLASPVDGVVSVRLAEAGQVSGAGQPVFRIAELDRPWVRAYLSEPDLARVKLGQAAEVRVDGLPGKVLAGRLSFISPTAEFTPKTVETRALRVDLVYRVRVDVDNAEGLLKIGMPADVRLSRP